MNRRDFIKRMLVGVGAVVALPSLPKLITKPTGYIKAIPTYGVSIPFDAERHLVSEEVTARIVSQWSDLEALK